MTVNVIDNTDKIKHIQFDIQRLCNDIEKLKNIIHELNIEVNNQQILLDENINRNNLVSLQKCKSCKGEGLIFDEYNGCMHCSEGIECEICGGQGKLYGFSNK